MLIKIQIPSDTVGTVVEMTTNFSGGADAYQKLLAAPSETALGDLHEQIILYGIMTPPTNIDRDVFGINLSDHTYNAYGQNEDGEDVLIYEGISNADQPEEPTELVQEVEPVEEFVVESEDEPEGALITEVDDPANILDYEEDEMNGSDSPAPQVADEPEELEEVVARDFEIPEIPIIPEPILAEVEVDDEEYSVIDVAGSVLPQVEQTVPAPTYIEPEATLVTVTSTSEASPDELEISLVNLKETLGHTISNKEQTQGILDAALRELDSLQESVNSTRQELIEVTAYEAQLVAEIAEVESQIKNRKPATFEDAVRFLQEKYGEEAYNKLLGIL